MAEQIKVLLPLSMDVVAKLLLAIGDAFPDAVVVAPAADDVARHGEILIIEVRR